MARIYKTIRKKTNYPDNHYGDYGDLGDHSPKVRYLGMWSQVGLRKHHYKQN